MNGPSFQVSDNKNIFNALIRCYIPHFLAIIYESQVNQFGWREHVNLNGTINANDPHILVSSSLICLIWSYAEEEFHKSALRLTISIKCDNQQCYTRNIYK